MKTKEKVTTDQAIRYRVTLAPLGSEGPDETPCPGALPPRYDRERDEAAFEKAWQKVDEQLSHGELRPMPPPPPGGFRLRGGRCKKTT